ncbi:MAG: competence/damage-inducible protein A [Chloroflexi bacterium]|nr:competence/damage-inducible protein A [Chloroflexota bacterium]
MRAEIVAIGTEILMGQIVDTNSAWLAARLPALGIDNLRHTAVGDNLERLAEALATAWNRSELVICTGGLGPTEDDVTREAIAAMLGEQPYQVPELEQALRERFARRGMPMPERNLKQATLIPSARIVPNPRGTAPGWWVEQPGHILVCMPGVRSETYVMWDTEVAPRLRALTGETVILSRLFKTHGIGEGTVDEMLGDLLHSWNPSIGVYAKQDGVHIRLTAKAEGQANAEALLEAPANGIKGIFGAAIWAEGDDEVTHIIGKLLKARGQTLATMESCTGGHIANDITDVPGSSAYFKGGAVTYTNAMKIAWGVDPAIIERDGAVSAACAEAMAVAIRERTGADYGLSVTGVAGPDTEEGKPVGTVFIGIAGARGVRSTNQGFYPPGRAEIKQRAAINALHLLRRYLLEAE